MMTSYSTRLVKGAVYLTTALVRPILINIFGIKIVGLSEVFFFSFFLSCSDDDPFGENQILTHKLARAIKSVHNINTNRWSPSIGNQFHKSIYRKWLSQPEQIHYWFNCGSLRLQEVIWKVTLSKSNGFVQYLCFKGGGAKAFNHRAQRGRTVSPSSVGGHTLPLAWDECRSSATATLSWNHRVCVSAVSVSFHSS